MMKDIERLSPKEAFLKQFDETYKDTLLPEEWGQDKKDRVAFLTTSNKTKVMMFTSIPMNCQGSSCMFADTCPLYKESIHPLNKPCPLELGMVKNFMADYMQQLDIDADNLVELSMIRDLVDQEVQYLRKTKLLSKESFIQQNVVGMDPEGDPIMRKELHQAVELEDKLHKRKQALFKQLLATREQKAKIGLSALDNAQTMSNLLMAMKSIQDQRESDLKQKLGIIDQDDYIDIPIEDTTEDNES